MPNLKNLFVAQRSSYYQRKRLHYFSGVRSLFQSCPTIISNNCFAGFIYADLKLPYTSPTIGLYFFFPDYIDFLEHLPTAIYSKLSFVKESKYDLGNHRHKEKDCRYPIALLDEKYEIHFLHYSNKRDAEQTWMKRVERVDLSNLVVFGTQLDLCRNEDIYRFEQLPFDKKFFFTKQIDDERTNILVKGFADNSNIGDPFRSGHILYKSLADRLVQQRRSHP